MGIVAFNWAEEDNNQLTLVMNRESGEGERDITGTFWEGNIFCCRFEANFGTWYGITKRGRFAFLLSSWSYERFDSDEGDLYPTDFLEGNMTPQEFADHMAQIDGYDGLDYRLIVGVMNLNSMVYISKPDEDEPNVQIQPFPFGVHTLSTKGGSIPQNITG